MSFDVLPDRPIVFFGGKGGVGKTTMAAAVALRSADEGRSTLLVSTDPAHSTGDILGHELGSDPRSVTPGLWAVELDPAAEAESYIGAVKARIAEATPPRLAAEVERQIDVARVSPGAQEAALFERFTRILEEADRYERIVFDTAPTAQTLRLLSLPELMATWIAGLVDRRRKVSALGRMWRSVAGAAAAGGVVEDPVLQALEDRLGRFRQAREVLADPGKTAFVFVIVPDRLPVLETHRAMSTLASYAIPVGGLIVNQVLPADPGGEYLRRRRAMQTAHLADIESRFSDWPISYVPLLEEDPTGLDALRGLMERVHAGAGVPAS